MSKPEHIVSLSGGKDSTWMLLWLLENNYPVDEIIMFDTGWEFPEMYDHLKQLENYIGRQITIIKDKNGLDYWFDHIKTKGKNKGQRGYGWPDFSNRWCTALKRDNIRRYLRGRNYTTYIGIAVDEPKRIKISKNSEIIYPLVEQNFTENQALELCYSRGFDWGGLYEAFNRVSCFCCPLQSIKELEALYNQYPELWQRIKDMDIKSFRKFRSDYSIYDLEDKFMKKKVKVINA